MTIEERKFVNGPGIPGRNADLSVMDSAFATDCDSSGYGSAYTPLIDISSIFNGVGAFPRAVLEYDFRADKMAYKEKSRYPAVAFCIRPGYSISRLRQGRDPFIAVLRTGTNEINGQGA